MKKIIVSVAVLTALLATSCDEERLEIQQKSASNTADFYKTDEDAQSARTAMYGTYQTQIAGNEGIWNAYLMGLNYSSDDVFAAGGGITDHADFRIVNEFRYDASSNPIGTLYNHIYKSIYSANLIIDNFGGDKADSQIKKRIVAEAKVMRAWAHMLAAIVYKQPPIIDHCITDEIPLNADSQADILKFCIKDCDDAMPDLEERKGANDKEGAWYATKGFAQFVAGKAALFLGDMDKVISEIKPLVESPNYALVPGKDFRNLFHVEGDGCSEKIFEFNFTANTALGGSWGEDSRGRGRWMVQSVLNWRKDDIVGGTANIKRISCVGWGGGSINQDFAHKMLDNDGDSYRRKATFITSEEFFYDEELCPWGDDFTEKGNKANNTRAFKEMDYNRGIKNNDGSFARSDVMEVKMLMHPNDAGTDVGSDCNNTNFCLARLAEAYLIYAEACIKNGQNAEALKYINKIQERAGSKTISSEATMQVLMDEKQYELWFEGCRWNDLVRWGIAKECYDKVLDNIPYQYDEFWWPSNSKGEPATPKKIKDKDKDGKEIEKVIPVDTDGKTELPINGRPHKLYYQVRHPLHEAKVYSPFVEGKHEYWPLPQSVLDVNPSMHQVGGWQ